MKLITIKLNPGPNEGVFWHVVAFVGSVLLTAWVNIEIFIAFVLRRQETHSEILRAWILRVWLKNGGK